MELADIEEEGLKHLESIEQDLEEIKERTPIRRHAFLHGIMYGAGAVFGGVLGIAFLGWILSLFGVIPGLGDIANYLQGIVDRFQR